MRKQTQIRLSKLLLKMTSLFPSQCTPCSCAHQRLTDAFNFLHNRKGFKEHSVTAISFSKPNSYNHKQERGKIDTERYKWRLSVNLYRRQRADGRDLQ